jgi:acyl-CoA reductase-like NAD-dependent aldehyde dehydrogenase
VLFNKGEACTASSRLLVQKGVYERFIEKLAAGIPRLVVGNGMNPKTHIGPCVSKKQQQRVMKYIQIGKDAGAEIAAQGNLPSDPACKDGFFVPPDGLQACDARDDDHPGRNVWTTGRCHTI